MNTAEQWLFLLPAGVIAGIIGTSGGITSLVAYPAVLVTGISPLAANVTTSVALLGSGFTSALRARPDLAGHGRRLLRWLPGTVIVSALGGLLLVSTPSGVFDKVVGLLVAAGALILLLQPQIATARGRMPAREVAIAGASVALYNGYFGAGSGILMITLLMLSAEPVLHRANSFKNVLLFVSDLAPTVIFAISGTIVWSAVWPLGLGAMIGGLIGPSIARRTPERPLRIFIATCGLALAAWLLIDAWL